MKRYVGLVLLMLLVAAFAWAHFVGIPADKRRDATAITTQLEEAGVPHEEARCVGEHLAEHQYRSKWMTEEQEAEQERGWIAAAKEACS